MTWIEHDGSSVPSLVRPGDLVQVRFRDGDETVKPEIVAYWGGASSNWKWDRRNPSDSEIVAYKRAGK